MIDFNLIKTDPDAVSAALAKRGYVVDFTDILALDAKRRELIAAIDADKATRNRVSAQIPQMKKEGKDCAPIFEEMKQLGARIAEGDASLGAVEAELKEKLSCLPNMPADDVVAGGKENNRVIRTFGTQPTFDFEAKAHVEICESLGLIDYKRGAKLGGNGMWIYRGAGARLEWALLNYFIEEHLKDGYEFLLVPHMLNYECGYTAGQFPKFTDEVYWLDGERGPGARFILPTAETALVNLHRDEVLNEDDLPFKYCAYTPCYRREAGSYRSEERGMIRGHQFNKVEMVQYTTPENSEAAYQELIAKAERLVQGLGLHYQVSKLAAGDCSASMACTTDIEVWLPSMGIYKEVSSASNARDYQARRGNIRYRVKETGRLAYVHTLNASGLATSRVLPAIVEQFQNADGSVTVPEVLRKYFGADRITK